MSVLETIKQGKLLSGICLDVYEIISNYAGLTIGQIHRKYQAMRPEHKGRGRNEIAKRVRDLELWGAIAKGEKDYCSTTSCLVWTYNATGLLPKRGFKKGTEPTVVTEGTPRPYQASIAPLRMAEKLSPLDVAALLEAKNDELKALSERAQRVASEALDLDTKLTNIVTAVVSGANHIEALKRERAELYGKYNSWWRTYTTKRELAKRLAAIDFTLRTLDCVQKLEGAA